MKYATVKNIMSSFPHPLLPTAQGELDYQTINATRKFLQANSRAIETHLGSGTLGHLGLIISDTYYIMIARTTDAGPILWTTPQSPERSPAITSVFEPIYLDILNDNTVGYANILARDILDHLFETYGNTTAVDLKINFENMRRAWDPQQPVESLFKQIQDCADYSEAGGVLIGHPQQINVGYAKIFATGHHFMSACRWWNEKHTIEKTWTQFKSHFAATHCQHMQMQGESAATAGYPSANAAVTHNQDQMAEATIGALSNLATATAADRGVLAALTQANVRLAKQLEDNSNELRELKALLNKERSAKCGQRSFNPSPINYCWNRGFKVGSTHMSLTCKIPKPGHKKRGHSSGYNGR
jgi:hypothetical protein